jgi:hypothetical protein
MQNLHAELAVQQRINASVGSGKKFGQDLLKSEANSTMNHGMVSETIDQLGLAQSVPKRREKHRKYTKIC